MYTTGRVGEGSRADLAHRELKRRLLRGGFGLAERLAEERLAAQLGVSRTPVREALVRLHAEGLLERNPDGGYRPTPPDLQANRELYEARIGLELTALQRARVQGGHDRGQLEALRADWQALDIPAPDDEVAPSFVLLDEDFHVRLASAAGNHTLVQLLIGVNERIRLVRMQDFLTGDRVAATAAQHLGVVESLLEGLPTRAERLLREHFAESMRIVEERAALALARMVSRLGATEGGGR
ncbi:MAG: GntR family transcriptional regulator [Egibacteraceae bacterium]